MRSTGQTFRKSSFCNDSGCVEVAIRGDVINVRDAKDPAGAVLVFTRDEWKAFLAGVKALEFEVD